MKIINFWQIPDKRIKNEDYQLPANSVFCSVPEKRASRKEKKKKWGWGVYLFRSGSNAGGIGGDFPALGDFFGGSLGFIGM